MQDKRVWFYGGLLIGILMNQNAIANPFSQSASPPATESPVNVVITGAEKALEENLRAHLPHRGGLSCTTSQERIQRFVDASHKGFVEAAEALGYFSAQFTIQPQRPSDCWLINVQVDAGSPVRVRESTIRIQGEGESLAPFRKILAEPPFRQGDILVSQDYDNFRDSLSRAATRLGFFDATFLKREILVDPEAGDAIINLHFDTGERYQVGEVKVEQDVLAGKYLNRYIQLQSGRAYNTNDILAQQRLLESSGYYRDVRITTEYRQADGKQVPIEILAIRRQRYSYTGNLGYGTDTGIRAEVGMTAHWVNSRGHKLDGVARFSEAASNVTFNYRIPLWQPQHEFVILSGGWGITDNKDIKGESLNAELSYNRRTDNEWQQALFVNLLDEKTQVRREDPSRARLTLFGARLSKTERDDILFPTQGWQLRAEVQGAYDSFLSDHSLLQFNAQGRYLTTFNNDGKLILRGAVGTTLVNELSTMPKSLRFFSGGQTSVRGYGFESLGERDQDGNVIGGKHMLNLSAEYEHLIRHNIGAAAFVDAGNAFDDWERPDLKVGIGVGARYRSPIGPIRIDFAVPQDNLSDVHFYFSLGPDL